MRDPYLYEDVDVLKNKYGIKDKNALQNLESNLIPAKLATADSIKGNFDYNHYKQLNKHIFGDIYEWAGEEREIPVEKPEKVLGGLSVQYTYPSEIESDAKKCIAKLNKTDWNNVPNDKKPEEFAKDIAALWQVHPFREGNTRTAITFACQFADAHGFPMDETIFAEHAGFTRNALVMASLGQYSEPEHLTRIFKDSMERGAAKQLEKTAVQTEKPNINISRFDKTIDTTMTTELHDNSYDYN